MPFKVINKRLTYIEHLFMWYKAPSKAGEASSSNQPNLAAVQQNVRRSFIIRGTAPGALFVISQCRREGVFRKSHIDVCHAILRVAIFWLDTHIVNLAASDHHCFFTVSDSTASRLAPLRQAHPPSHPLESAHHQQLDHSLAGVDLLCCRRGSAQHRRRRRRRAASGAALRASLRCASLLQRDRAAVHRTVCPDRTATEGNLCSSGGCGVLA